MTEEPRAGRGTGEGRGARLREPVRRLANNAFKAGHRGTQQLPSSQLRLQPLLQVRGGVGPPSPVVQLSGNGVALGMASCFLNVPL